MTGNAQVLSGPLKWDGSWLISWIWSIWIVDMHIFLYIYIFAFRIFDNEDTNKNITSCSIAAK
jgi:hypothetical protein